MTLERYRNAARQWEVMGEIDSADTAAALIKTSPVVQPETVYISKMDYDDGCTRIYAKSIYGSQFAYRVGGVTSL